MPPPVRVAVTITSSSISIGRPRTGGRIDDQPMRVEVLDREEIEEKMLMTPGDIVMMLNEMGGMRVQTTSPSLGAASVRIQGMRGRYTRVSVRRPAAVRRAGRRPRPAADSADGSRPGRGDQRRRVVAVWRRRDGRRRQPGVAAAGDEAEHEFLINRSTPRRHRRRRVCSRRRCRDAGAARCSAAGTGRRQTDVDGDGWADLAGYCARRRAAARVLGRRRRARRSSRRRASRAKTATAARSPARCCRRPARRTSRRSTRAASMPASSARRS